MRIPILVLLVGSLSLFACQDAKSNSIKGICRELRVDYPPRKLFFRAFKQERELEIWAETRSGQMVRLRVYPIAAASGGPGPKRREGDLQVPEGVYHIDRFNPNSRYHLSLGLNYPNPSDRILGDEARPGSDIFIHGNQVSIGCLAMTDEKIEEIYALAKGAQGRIPVHIFPCRMQGNAYASLKRGYPQHVPFWKQLEKIYLAFESKKSIPAVAIEKDGRYRVDSRG